MINPSQIGRSIPVDPGALHRAHETGVVCRRPVHGAAVVPHDKIPRPQLERTSRVEFSGM